ncbi:MAG: DNA gyrase inhibitor YacG [Ancalomicrobiaceae bacterium]|nr:DNA gyrase inhibitor YacG [Ancalomicrobiaceae bacterium]
MTEEKDSRTPRPCPNCGKMSLPQTYPFCSKRCRMVDLNRWLNGSYAIPAVESDGDDDV